MLDSNFVQVSHFKNYNYETNNLLSLRKDQFGINIRNDLITSQNELFNLVLNNSKPIDNKFVVDIESDIQYEKDDKFYAEGNVVVYFSNAKLTGNNAAYDRNNKEFVIEGDVVFTKGSQYFEASRLSYNFEVDNGTIDNIYGVLDINDINLDLELESSKEIEKNKNSKNEVSELEYINSASLGLVSDFKANSKFNFNSIKFDVRDIQKWRFKSEKLYLESNKLRSKKIFFTNDAFNKPQFLLQSKNFSGEIVEDKLKIISRNSQIIFDDFLKLPIGRRTIFDDDPATTTWGIGLDSDERDGLYIQRTFGEHQFIED